MKIFSALKEFHETFKQFEFSKETAERDRGREGALLRQRRRKRPDAGPELCSRLIRHHPSSSSTIHHHKLSSIIIQYHPSLSIIVRRHPSPSLIFHHTIIVHDHPPLTVHNYHHPPSYSLHFHPSSIKYNQISTCHNPSSLYQSMVSGDHQPSSNIAHRRSTSSRL